MSAVTNRIRRLIEGVDKLNSFETITQVEEFFKDLGSKGRRNGNASDCIVAVFLKDCMGDPDAYIKVGCRDVTHRWPKESGEQPVGAGNYLLLRFNRPVWAFITEFDHGAYPDLVEPEESDAQPG